MKKTAIVLLTLLGLVACSGPRPILYPNAHLEAVGAAGGAVGGAVVGAAGSGSAIGAASGATMGLLRGLFSSPKPSQAYMHFVDRCLKERGYEPMGWE